MGILKINDLSIKLENGQKTVSIVNKVSFSLEEGKTIALIGQSGSGKTITALAIMGLLPKELSTEGSILFDDKNLLSLTSKEKRKYRGQTIAYTLQNSGSLNPALKIKKQLIEKSLKTKYEDAIELLNQVGLEDEILHMYPHQLSGGMKQRVLLAIALVQNPTVLIADEPTSGLDTANAAKSLDLVEKLSTVRKLSTILISHDLGLVGSRADRIMVMKDGCIVEQGAKEKIMNNPRNSYTKALLKASQTVGNKIATPRRNVGTRNDVIARSEGDPHARHYEEAEGQRGNLDKITGSGQAPQGKIKILKVKNISRSYKRSLLETNAKILSGISFSVKKGQNLGLVGSSGAGKTTIAKIIAGLIEPDSGRIFNNCENGSGAKVQMVFQDYGASLNPRMNAKTIITEPYKLAGINDADINKRLKELLPKVGMDESWLNKYPHQFSGGQKQRLAIVRAIALHPKLLILDEPFSSQDVLVRNEILLLLKKLQTEFDITYILISHDQVLVENFCQRIINIDKGKIIDQLTENGK